MKVIVGLGNPGVRYQGSRHNIGFQVVDRLAETHHILIDHRRFKTLFGTGSIDSHSVVLAKPLTFMNLSGAGVKSTLRHFSVGVDDLLVIHDDLDLPFGRLRIKRWGGDGGHQGVRSIIDSLGGNHFLRMKIGIGRPPRGMDPADYVLEAFREDEQSPLDEILSRAAEAVAVILSEGVETAMNQYQKKPIPSSLSP